MQHYKNAYLSIIKSLYCIATVSVDLPLTVHPTSDNSTDAAPFDIWPRARWVSCNASCTGRFVVRTKVSSANMANRMRDWYAKREVDE